MKHFFLYILFVFFIVGCAPLNRISNRDLATQYDPVKDLLFPKYQVYNVTDTSTRLYIKISTEDILYQQQGNGELLSEVFVGIRVYESYETDKFSDSCSVNIFDKKEDEEVHSLIQFIDFKTPAAKLYVLEITLTDMNRHLSQKTYLSVNNKSKQSPVNFLVVHAEDSLPVFSSFVSSTTNFKILCRKELQQEVYVRYFNRRYPLAAPAFRYVEMETFNYRSDRTNKINLASGNEYSFRDQGIYHIQADSNILQGLTIYRFSDDYPKVTKADELVEPLRYLTTNREFNQIKNSSDKKAAIDAFWLDVAGNKTKGRELIRLFYKRVEDSNRMFTSYEEGWKTDRGLIYIIFGEPDVVYRGAVKEDWNYAGTFEHGPINFTFEKINNPFTDEDYNLQRSVSYQELWYLAVDEWRQGRKMEVE